MSNKNIILIFYKMYTLYTLFYISIYVNKKIEKGDNIMIKRILLKLFGKKVRKTSKIQKISKVGISVKV